MGKECLFTFQKSLNFLIFEKENKVLISKKTTDKNSTVAREYHTNLSLAGNNKTGMINN